MPTKRREAIAKKCENPRLVKENVAMLTKVRERDAARHGWQQRFAEWLTRFSGSMAFVHLHAIWFAGWMFLNSGWWTDNVFDPPPFGLLTLIVSLEAIFLSIFVLISQNRQAGKDRLAAEIDHQVNTKAEVEIGLVLRRLDDLEESLRFYKDEQRKLLRSISVDPTDNGR